MSANIEVVNQWEDVFVFGVAYSDVLLPISRSC